MELRPDTQALLRNALNAAERGWHVFPVAVDAKWPALHRAEKCPRTGACAEGHLGWEQRATIDPDRIRRCWAAAPYNIGIACGPSRLAVIDLDMPKPGKETPPVQWRMPGVADGGDVFAVVCERAGQPVPNVTHTVTTGRAGTHLYYIHPTTGPRLRNTTGGTAGSLGWLIDTRAHGGYVLGAGSVVNGRPYTAVAELEPVPLPDWLAERLAPAPLPEQRPVVVELGTDRHGAYLRAAIDRETATVASAAAGTRNRALYGAAVALGQLAAGGALAADDAAGLLLTAALDAGLRGGAPEARRTIASGFRAGARRPRSVAA